MSIRFNTLSRFSSLSDGFMAKRIPRKKTSKPEKALIDLHAKRIGKIAWAWNELHSLFQIFFAHFVDMAKLEFGISVWHALSSDAAQREILEALAKEKWGNTKNVTLCHLLWATKMAGRLSGLRNAYIHSCMEYTVTPLGKSIYPSIFANPKHAKKFSNDSAKDFHAIHSDLKSVAAHSRLIFRRFFDTKDAPRSWRKTPILRSFPKSEQGLPTHNPLNPQNPL